MFGNQIPYSSLFLAKAYFSGLYNLFKVEITRIFNANFCLFLLQNIFILLQIKLDVDLIRVDEAVDLSDVSVQAVEQLPKGFIEETIEDAKSGKKLIEELD